MLKAVVPDVFLASTKLPHPANLHRTGRDRAPLEYQRRPHEGDAALASTFFGQPDPDAAQLWHVACRGGTSFMSLLPHDAPSRPLCSRPPDNLYGHTTSGYLVCGVVNYKTCSEQQYWDTGIEVILQPLDAHGCGHN